MMKMFTLRKLAYLLGIVALWMPLSPVFASGAGSYFCERVLFPLDEKQILGRVALEVLPGFAPNPIGSGGFGKVYLANTREGSFAIKVIKTDGSATGDAKKAFERLSQFKEEFSDPYFKEHAIDFTHFDSKNEFVIYKALKGQSLHRHLRLPKKSQRSFYQNWNLMYQMGLSLKAYHRLGLIHNDVKPENFIVEQVPQNQYPTVRLIDADLVSRVGEKIYSTAGTSGFQENESDYEFPGTQSKDMHALKITSQIILLEQNFSFDIGHGGSDPNGVKLTGMTKWFSPSSYDGNIDEMLSAIAFYQFNQIDDYLNALEVALSAELAKDPTHFYSYFYKNELSKLIYAKMVHYIASSRELGVALENNWFGLEHPFLQQLIVHVKNKKADRWMRLNKTYLEKGRTR